MKTIIVTGGAGYIGSHTIIELIENTNYRVVSIDNFSNSFPKTYERIEKITGVKIDHYDIDLCDKQAVKEVFQKENEVEGIVHFAAFKSVPESVENPYKYFHNNFESLLNVVEIALEKNISNLIFSSSCSVYGNISSLPVNEETLFNKAESPYAYTKQVGEEMLITYTNRFKNLQVAALRYFNPVGAHFSGLNGELPIHKPTSLVPVITQTAIGIIEQMAVFGDDYITRDGSCIRDYIHVTDIAQAHIKALEYLVEQKNKSNFTVINLGSGEGVSVFEAIEAFEKATGEKLNYIVKPRREGDVEAIYSDTTKSQKELNWKTTHTIEQMMSSAWKWQQNLEKEESK